MRTAMKAALALGALAAVARLAARRRRLWQSFEGRVVLVTGGSRGLGLALAREFARRGARVAICARDERELDAARADLEARGAQVLARVCDVTVEAKAAEFAREVESVFGRVDVLVNNAGVIQVGPVETMTRLDFDWAMKTHYWAALNFIWAVLPGMRRRGEGRIVNVASIGGKIAVPHLLPYDASKFALVGLSEGLRAELARDGIWVTTVCPGMMRTGSAINAWFKGQHKKEYAWFSIGDSLPVASVGAARAARRIVEACRAGRAHVVLTLPGKAAALFHGLFPGATADLLGLVNRLLPRPGGVGVRARSGRESESAVTRTLVTRLSRDAERRNNQRP